jgi:hypothetical protein
MASPQIIWDAIRETDAFMVRRDGVTFSRDPKNLTGRHSYKYSGLAQPKSLGITLSMSDDKKSTITLTKTGKSVNRPREACRDTVLKGRAAGLAEIEKAIGADYYRPDLKAAALARYGMLLRSVGAKADVRPGKVGGRHNWTRKYKH